MHLSRRRSLALLAAPLFLSVLGRPALAGEPKVFSTMGIAINGADPVGYFMAGKPVEGSAAHAVRWRRAEWYFVSRENRDRFEADPVTHAPRFGGYCAYAASKGYLAPTVPEAWAVHEGRLYLNASLRARELWLRDVPGNIAKAEANWPGILG